MRSVDGSVGMRPMMYRSQFGRDDLDSSAHSVGSSRGASNAMRSVDGSLGMRPMMHRPQFGRDDLDSSAHSVGGNLGMRSMMNRSQFGRDEVLDSSAHSVGSRGASNTMRSVDSTNLGMLPVTNRSHHDAPQSHRMTIAKPSLEEQGLIQILQCRRLVCKSFRIYIFLPKIVTCWLRLERFKSL
jgi:hypothetical protein